MHGAVPVHVGIYHTRVRRAEVDVSKYLWKIALASVAVYSILILAGDAPQLAGGLEGFGWQYLPLALGIFSASVSVRALRYHLWLRTMVPGITYKDTARYYVAGLSFLVTPARMGEAVISIFIKEKFGTAKSRTVPLVLLERFYDLVGLSVLLAASMTYSEAEPVMLALPASLIAAALIISGKKCLVERILARIGKIKFLSKFAPDAAESSDTLHSLTRPRFFAISAGMGTVIPLMDIAGAYMLVLGLGINLAFPEAVFAISVSVIVAALSFVPGGLFVAEGGQIGILTGLYGVGYAQALLFALMYRISFTWFLTGAGIVFLKRISGGGSV